MLVLSHSVCPFVTLGIIAHQAPLSMDFSKQQYWSGLPFPSPGDLPDPGIEPVSPALAGRFFTTALPGKPKRMHKVCNSMYGNVTMKMGRRGKNGLKRGTKNFLKLIFFGVLCCFLLYSKMNPPYRHIYPLPFGPPIQVTTGH